MFHPPILCLLHPSFPIGSSIPSHYSSNQKLLGRFNDGILFNFSAHVGFLLFSIHSDGMESDRGMKVATKQHAIKSWGHFSLCSVVLNSRRRKDGFEDDREFNTSNLGVLFICWNSSGHWPVHEKIVKFIFVFKSFYWSLPSFKGTNGGKPMFPTTQKLLQWLWRCV